MPLRITIEIIPHGNESKKKRLAVVECENDTTADKLGSGPVGNYVVSGEAELRDHGWDAFEPVRAVGVRRQKDGQTDYVNVAAACLSALANGLAQTRAD